MKPHTLRQAGIGSISTGTTRTVDLLTAFMQELESFTLLSGDYLSQNHTERDRFANLIGEAQDCFNEDDDDIDPEKEDEADELVNETLPDALNQFAPPYCYFGSHPGDGADFGFWPMDVEDIKEQVDFVSSRRQEYPDDDFTGEWLHINDHGNCTLYVRTDAGEDTEIWSIV